VGVEAGFRQRALSLNETLLGLRAAENGTVLRSFRLLKLASLQLSRSAQVDDLGQAAPQLFLAEGVD
jgi:hypothetical protein